MAKEGLYAEPVPYYADNGKLEELKAEKKRLQSRLQSGLGWVEEQRVEGRLTEIDFEVQMIEGVMNEKPSGEEAAAATYLAMVQAGRKRETSEPEFAEPKPYWES